MAFERSDNTRAVSSFLSMAFNIESVLKMFRVSVQCSFYFLFDEERARFSYKVTSELFEYDSFTNFGSYALLLHFFIALSRFPSVYYATLLKRFHEYLSTIKSLFCNKNHFKPCIFYKDGYGRIFTCKLFSYL